MPFPLTWPPRVPSGIRSIRFFVSGTAAAAFDANAFMFLDGVGANPITPAPIVPYGSNAPVVNPLTPTGTGTTAPPLVPPMLWAGNIRVFNDGGAPLEISFNGTDVHGRILVADKFLTYKTRYEAGIAVRGAGAAFRIEAW